MDLIIQIAILIILVVGLALIYLRLQKSKSDTVQPLHQVETAIRAEAQAGRVESSDGAKQLRGEVSTSIRDLGAEVRKVVVDLGAGYSDQFATFAQVLAQARTEAQTAAKGQREEIVATLEKLGNGQAERLTLLAQQQGERLEEVGKRLTTMTQQNEKQFDELRKSVELKLETIRTENEGKLEKIRATVEEQLQGTLEKKLGESFQLVSERLEQVHKGLGEMQGLASGVGDLKRVLTNIKSRGGWGEVQLGALLDDMLTPTQFERNAKIDPASNEVVEYAVRLPGKGDDRPVLLPIDSKYPHEDYDRLLLAQDKGASGEIESSSAALERAIRIQAKTISEKYIRAPHSTDFAIMYLPTEGLFAEIIRRPGLCMDIQSKHRVMITGPTTLAALLNSLQMGFRTLAIEQRSSEVWKVLGAAKEEFRKYAVVWDKLGKQLDTARKTVEEAGQRTRAVEKRLKDVEIIPLPNGPTPLIAELSILDGPHADDMDDDDTDEIGESEEKT